MSLILDALRKLEREKQRPERGIVVLSAPQPVRSLRSSRAAITAGSLILLAGLAGAIVHFRNDRAAPTQRPASAAGPAGATVTPSEPLTSSATAMAEPPIPPARPLANTRPSPASARATTEAPKATWQLQAISQRDGKPIAILNDRLVQEGESFDGIRVVRIGAAEVEIEFHGRRQVIGF